MNPLTRISVARPKAVLALVLGVTAVLGCQLRFIVILPQAPTSLVKKHRPRGA